MACSADRFNHLTPSFGRLDSERLPLSSAVPSLYIAPGCNATAAFLHNQLCAEESKNPLVKRDGFCTLPAASPAMLTTSPSPVASIRMSMLRRQYKQWECPVEVLLSSNRPYPIRIAVGQKVLCIWVPSICQPLQQPRGLLGQLILLVRQRQRCATIFAPYRSGLWIRWCHGFRRVDHEYRKFKYELWVIRLLGVFSIQLERAVVGEKLCFFAGAEMGYIEQRARARSRDDQNMGAKENGASAQSFYRRLR